MQRGPPRFPGSPWRRSRYWLRPITSRRTRPTAGHLRARLQSDLAATGIGLAELEGAATALVYGSGWPRSAPLCARWPDRVDAGCPRRRLLPDTPVCDGILTPLGVNVFEATRAHLRCGRRCRRRAGRDAEQPRLDVVDLHRLAPVCRGRRARLIVDNTTATPLGSATASLGADLVVASATKVLLGHSDLLAGYVAGSQPGVDRRAGTRTATGRGDPRPVRGVALIRSLGSAGLRFERQCHNAQALATMLPGHPAVKLVRYPGLPGDPAHPVAATQMRRFGGLVPSNWPTPRR